MSSAATAPITLRVLHLHSGNMMGGVESAIRTLAEHAFECPQLCQEIALVFDGAFSNSIANTGIPVHKLPRARLRNPLSILRSRRALLELLTRRDFDVIVSHSPWCQAVFGPIPRRASIPFVPMMHGPFTGHWIQRLASRYSPALLLCNSQYTQSSLPNAHRRIPSEVVYLPVSAPKPFPNRNQLRQDLGASSVTAVILIASRMERWKGHLNLLRAASQLHTTADWTIWIAGGPQTKKEHRYYASLRAEVIRLGLEGSVRLLGQRTDVPALMQSCDIHCQPNELPEPFGMVFIEAMRAGVPSIAIAMGGPMEILDQHSGILLPPGNIPRLTAALELLIDNPTLRTQYGKAGQARAQHRFSPERQLKNIFQALSRTVQTKHRSANKQWV